MLSVAVAWLPRSELARDLEYAQEVAERVASAENGACTRASRGLGYKVTVPYRNRNILVRVMARSGSGQNYYRVTVPGLGAAERDGRLTDNPATTHHPLSGFSFTDVDDILDIIIKIRERRE